MQNYTSKILVLIVIVLIGIQVNAQKNVDITVAMGSVHPLKNFKEEGYAQNGFNLQVTADYPLFDLFSVSGKFMFANAGLNQTRYKSFLTSTYSDYMSDVFRFDLTDWIWATPLVGLKYRYPIIIQKFYLTAAAYSGLSYHQTPDLNMSVLHEAENKEFIVQTSSNYNLSIPVLGEIGVLFKANDNLLFNISISYFGANATYNQEAYTINHDTKKTDERLSNEEFNIPIQTIQSSFGLVYRL